ncbi:hypothetical protein E0485_14610 [Paenibacillus albiflavus]|uniref:Uncharacterized protein n=1 Tax=Paenibacillus albiflavus TaxID=2545760 RepID=A0A4R4EDK7_9BACL|nr:hypothetical protein [Paenibacillus albiflavus]TCZ76075.1 hypothetical protein E0485_14610 [Paenibacillus albiflavus]
MNAIQLDLFADMDHGAVQAPTAPKVPILNGFYYEASTDKFISYSLGKRHYEEPAKGCKHLKEWQNWLKRERAI